VIAIGGNAAHPNCPVTTRASVRSSLMMTTDRNPTTLPSAGLFILRLVIGVTFLLHGLDTLGDLAAAERLFASLDIPAPGLMAPFVAVTETGGGVLLIVGLGTPLAGAALGVDMLVALATAHDDLVFFVGDGGIELELLLAGASFAIALLGAGRFSADSALGLPRRVSRRVGAGVAGRCARTARAGV
jgi:putative oxidoreductase